jgi:hypothetical protein
MPLYIGQYGRITSDEVTLPFHTDHTNMGMEGHYHFNVFSSSFSFLS